MLNPNTVDYKQLGFHAGLEIHHQIIATRKLFCHCPPLMVHNNTPPDYRFERYFRPVLGEMGDFDEGMLVEYEKGYRCIYNAYEKCDCIYEQDEQPPFEPDIGALMSGYLLAHWLNITAFIDEIIFSRKQYLDGSITTGFQRTTVVGRDGHVMVDGKKVRISNLTIEEDAARRIKTENNGRTVYYNLDRLGIPLVEVITDHHDVDSPQELLKLARMIGLTLRISRIGKRGIGVARQDVNISIAGGDRVELKGVQDLAMIEKWCLHEALRQDMLLKIAHQLQERGFQKEELEHTYLDFSHLFEVPENYVVMGVRLPKFGGIIGEEVQPGKDFGQDVFEKASLISGVPLKHLFHSMEVEASALRKKHVEYAENYFFNHVSVETDANIRDVMKIGPNDAYVLALGTQKWVIHALKKIVERLKMAMKGVPQETRRALPDGNSEFLRVIHGKDRLYPDTDTPMIDIDLKKVQALKSQVGRRPWEIETEYKNKYGFSFNQVSQLIRHEHIDLFESLVQLHHIDPPLVFFFLEELLPKLRREGLSIAEITEKNMIEILQAGMKYQWDHIMLFEIAREKILQPKKDIAQIFNQITQISSQTIKYQQIWKEALNALRNQLQKSNFYHSLDKDAQKTYQISQLTGIIKRKWGQQVSGKEIFTYITTHFKEEDF